MSTLNSLFGAVWSYSIGGEPKWP